MQDSKKTPEELLLLGFSLAAVMAVASQSSDCGNTIKAGDVISFRSLLTMSDDNGPSTVRPGGK